MCFLSLFKNHAHCWKNEDTQTDLHSRRFPSGDFKFTQFSVNLIHKNNSFTSIKTSLHLMNRENEVKDKSLMISK